MAISRLIAGSLSRPQVSLSYRVCLPQGSDWVEFLSLGLEEEAGRSLVWLEPEFAEAGVDLVVESPSVISHKEAAGG